MTTPSMQEQLLRDRDMMRRKHWHTFKPNAVRAAFDELMNIERVHANAEVFFQGAVISEEERRQKSDEIMERVVEHTASYVAILKTAELAYQAIFELPELRDIWSAGQASINRIAKDTVDIALKKSLNFEDAYAEAVAM